MPSFDQRTHLFVGALLDGRIEGNRFLELRVGEDDLARVHVGGIDAALAEGRGDHAAREAFAVAHDQVGDARGEFENGGQPAQNLVELIEFLIDPGDERGGVFLILDQRGGGVAMARAQPRTDGQRAGAIALRCSRGGAQQLVGDLGHGADNDHGLPAHGNAAGHDGGGAIDGGRIFHRRAAEFHHYKAHAECPISMS